MNVAQRRAVGRVRRLVLQMSAAVLAGSGAQQKSSTPFLALLWEDEDGDRGWMMDSLHVCLRHEDCKDRAVAAIREWARPAKGEKTLAVWFVAWGWAAPNDGTRPSQHRQRQRILLAFESTLDKDVMHERALPDGKWIRGWGIGGRFADLIGREKHVKHLRVVRKTTAQEEGRS